MNNLALGQVIMLALFLGIAIPFLFGLINQYISSKFLKRLKIILKEQMIKQQKQDELYFKKSLSR